MIKINLLRSRVNQGGTQTGFDTSIEVGGSDNAKAGSEAIFKIALMVIFSFGVYIYEGQTIDSLNERRTLLQRQVATLKNKNKQLKATTKDAKASQKKINELEEKVEIVKALARVRLNELKALDFIQNIIPDKVWLSSIKYKDKKFDFSGRTVDDDSLTKFLSRLENKSLLKEVVLLKSRDVKGRGGLYKEFNISSMLGGEK